MPYCTQQDLVDRFGEDELIQLTDRNDVGTIDSTMVDAAISRAGNRIDLACRNRYALPLDPVDEVIVGIACDLARFRLYEDHPTEAVKQAKDDALADLRLIARGELTLSAAAAASGTSSGMPEFETGSRVFTRDSMDGF